MNINDFIEFLRTLRGKTWKIGPDGQIRCADFDHHGAPCCPLETVWAVKSGTVENYSEAYKNLGLTGSLTNIIVAADNHHPKRSEAAELRHLMLDALELEDAA